MLHLLKLHLYVLYSEAAACVFQGQRLAVWSGRAWQLGSQMASTQTAPSIPSCQEDTPSWVSQRRQRFLQIPASFAPSSLEAASTLGRAHVHGVRFTPLILRRWRYFRPARKYFHSSPEFGLFKTLTFSLSPLASRVISASCLMVIVFLVLTFPVVFF